MTSSHPDAFSEAPLSSQHSVRSRLLLPFTAYFLMLASTSFIAGGIVHLGLGENTVFYITLAAVGVVCFTAGNYLQEYVIQKNRRATGLGTFLLVSFVLSVGIGMMTGGIQHYLDNPLYSTVLIPVGLLLAVAAFAVRERLTLGRKVIRLTAGTLGVAALLFGGLGALSKVVATPAGHAHGAEAGTVPTTHPSPQGAAEQATEETAAPIPAVMPAETPGAAAEGHDDGHDH
ncbi:hypothetical protein [Deinococcus aerophilus]|uniref:Uncharacterized protein n=1 Tax=Deinococcus aerophilus TaxID=522488 RepID=A0ABQ2GZJ0_9DEIO|nr:hypothetical protein [Deinococcus aerophilus]GGM21655.1 hypothetical protein GCM10010841_31920 [Deinococcus aerophilus]